MQSPIKRESIPCVSGASGIRPCCKIAVFFAACQASGEKSHGFIWSITSGLRYKDRTDNVGEYAVAAKKCKQHQDDTCDNRIDVEILG